MNDRKNIDSKKNLNIIIFYGFLSLITIFF